jgi:flagellin-specific chaperone FliS
MFGMKKTLKDLESDGWEISPSDRDKILSQKNKEKLNKSIEKIADSVEKLAASLNKVKGASENSNALIETLISLQKNKNSDNSKALIETLIKHQKELIAAYAKKQVVVKEEKKKWDFTVERGRDNYISKILAEEI